MVFCSKCGKELPEKAYFCPKCGARTSNGVQANIPIPKERDYDWEEGLRQLFSAAAKEVEKALEITKEEVEKAFRMAREEIGKATSREIVCPHCGERVLADSRFCRKCGKELVKK